LADDQRSGFGLTKQILKIAFFFLKTEIFSALRFTMAKIVIIDDEPAMVEVIVTLCREKGHQVFPFNSAPKAVEQLDSIAPQVVVAAGALESPALLLRTGIGGPAVGQHLRLHPCTATLGIYDEDMQAWWGPPHSGLIDEFANHHGDGYGFLIETAQYAPGLIGSAVSNGCLRMNNADVTRLANTVEIGTPVQIA